MGILIVSGSPRHALTEQIVRMVWEASELKGEMISLADYHIQPCTGCGQCEHTNSCVLTDDMRILRDKIIEADAYIIGGANYFSMMNSLLHVFLERWYQFVHGGSLLLPGKLAVVVGVGGIDGTFVGEQIETILEYHLIQTIAKISINYSALGIYEPYESLPSWDVIRQKLFLSDSLHTLLVNRPDILQQIQNAGCQLREWLQRPRYRREVISTVKKRLSQRLSFPPKT